MADVNLNTTNTKYIDYTNANRIFMLRYSPHYPVWPNSKKKRKW